MYCRPHHILRRLNVGLKFKAAEVADSVLFYACQSEDGKGDFASLAIKDGFLEFRSAFYFIRSILYISYNLFPTDVFMDHNYPYFYPQLQPIPNQSCICT